MKSKEEIEKWIRDEISNPLIGKMITDFLEMGYPYEDVMEIIKPIIDNTPKVEEKLINMKLRQQYGEEILNSIFKK